MALSKGSQIKYMGVAYEAVAWERLCLWRFEVQGQAVWKQGGRLGKGEGEPAEALPGGSASSNVGRRQQARQELQGSPFNGDRAGEEVVVVVVGGGGRSGW